MKIIATFIIALTLSFDALAIESVEIQISQIGNPIVTPQKVQTVSILSQGMPNLKAVRLAPEDRQNEIFTEVFVYLVIVMVYSLYWRYFSTH
jgi:hypothetical protein